MIEIHGHGGESLLCAVRHWLLVDGDFQRVRTSASQPRRPSRGRKNGTASADSEAF